MENTQLLATALQQAIDPILVTDANLTAPGPIILYANAAFCRMTGYSESELCGRSPRLLQGAATERGVLDELRRKLSSGEPFTGATVNYKKDGTPFEIEWRASPVFASDGTITNYLSVHRDVTERKRFERQIEDYIQTLMQHKQDTEARNRQLEVATAQLQTLATTDGLTGLTNHRHFHHELSRVRRSDDAVSLMILDVDHFKALNDELGHSAGDAILQMLAQTMKACVRDEDVVARYGGEEFAVLLPGRSDDQALAIAERIRAAVEAAPSVHRQVTVSIGVTTAQNAIGTDRSMIDEADIALYAAKAAGRNRVRHHRHLQRQAIPAACIEQCAPSPNGCLRCQSVPASPATAQGSALLLGPHDLDAANTLRKALASAGFEFNALGPVLVVGKIEGRLLEIGTLLKDRLSSYTRSCIAAAYVPGGVTTAEQGMSALMFSKPLNQMIETMQHEWVRDALSQGWLFSVFHPIVDARSGETFAQEALIRARRAADGKVFGAGQIIEACAKLNLQHQLDQRARHAAIGGAAQHLPAPMRIFINFLPNTIYDPEICLRTTMEAAAEFKLEMSRLVFEVVETEKIPDMDHLLHILDYYRSRGMGTAVDDMGAGYTGIDYITALRPDFVKLDRELMLEAERDAEARRKMDAIIKACREQGAKVIAEGIETPPQAAMCIDAGVDYMQGFLFAKPACPPQPVTLPENYRREAA